MTIDMLTKTFLFCSLFMVIGTSVIAAPYVNIDCSEDDLMTVGSAAGHPVAADFDGDGQDDYGIYTTGGEWLIDTNHDGSISNPVTTGDQSFILGSPNSIPVYGDFDNNGTLDLGYFTAGSWVIDLNNNYTVDAGDRQVVFGWAGDTPITGDFDGDGIVQIGVFRGGSFILDLNQDWVLAPDIDISLPFGQAGDLPISGNWTGSGVDSIGVYRGGEWLLDQNSNFKWDGSTVDLYAPAFGSGTGIPVVGDWDQDGIDDIGYREGSNGMLDSIANRQSDYANCDPALNDPTLPYDPLSAPTPSDGTGVCMVDINSDGTIDPTEFDNCSNSICPIGMAKCVDPAEVLPTCPPGGSLNTSSDTCQAAATVSCPAGYIHDLSIDLCVSDPQCTEPGSIFNPTTDLCELIVNNVCPVGYVFDTTDQVCTKIVDCGSLGVYNQTNDRCEYPANWDCPIGYTYINSQCEAIPYCTPPLTYNAVSNRCEVPVINNCAAGFVWDANLNTCVAPPDCPPGSTLNTTTDRCETAQIAICDVGFTLDSTNGICWQDPICQQGGTFVPADHLCELPSIGDNCPVGFNFNIPLNSCVQAPACPPSSAYNTTTDRCEAVIINTCPAPFIYDEVSGLCVSPQTCPTGSSLQLNIGGGTNDRCVKPLGACPTGTSWNISLDSCVANPSCPAGSSFNPTTDQCEVAATNTCDPGFSYVAARGRCEKLPNCLAPGTYSTTLNKCTAPYSGTTCATGYSFDAGAGVCVATASCMGGSLNPTTEQCEASQNFSCPTAGYTYVPARSRCEKTPTCAYGTYNATYNLCVSSATKTCDFSNSGYTYNSSTGHCEIEPDCTKGIYNPATNLCEWTELDITHSATVNITGCGTSSCTVGGPVNLGFYGTVQLNYCWAEYTSGTCSGKSAQITFNFGEGTIASVRDPVWPGSNICNMPPCYGTYASTISSCPKSGGYLNQNAIPMGSSSPLRTCAGQQTVIGVSKDFLMGTVTNTSFSNGMVTKTASPKCPVFGMLDTVNDVCANASITATCPISGTTWNATVNDCISTPVCSGGILDEATDQCYQGSSSQCPTGYTLSGSLCIKTPSCATGGNYSAATNRCEATTTFNCPGGFSWDVPNNLCSVPASCLPGALDTGVDVCQSPNSFSCPATTPTFSGTTCRGGASCPASSSLNTGWNLCSAGSAGVCSAGFSLSATYDNCQKVPDCPTGSVISQPNNRCELASTTACTSGLSLDGSGTLCLATAACDIPSTLSSTQDLCMTAGSLLCAPGYTPNAMGLCTSLDLCVAPTVYNPSSLHCEQPNGFTCNAPFLQDTVNGICYHDTTCLPPGTYSPASDNCQSSGAKDCVLPTSVYDSLADVCWENPDCGAGSLNPDVDLCLAVATENCGTLTFDPTNILCYAPTLCAPGLYNSTTSRCEATVVRDCGTSGTMNFDAATNKCLGPYDCLNDPIFAGTMNPIFATTINQCTNIPNRDCPANYTYAGLPVQMCEAPIQCSIDTVYDTVTDVCAGGGSGSSCPLGAFPCAPTVASQSILIGCPVAGSNYDSGTQKCIRDSFAISGGPVHLGDYYHFYVDAANPKRIYTDMRLGGPGLGDFSFLEFDIIGGQVQIAGTMFQDGHFSATGSGNQIVWSDPTGTQVGSLTVGMAAGVVQISGAPIIIPSLLDVRPEGSSLAFYSPGGGPIGSLTFAQTLIEEDPLTEKETFCSPNSCEPDPSGPETLPLFSDYQNDGATDPATGACLGEVKIFNGKGSYCYKSGLKTSFFNCCSTNSGSFLFIQKMCNTESIETATAKEQGRTHFVGNKCMKDSFFGCLQSAQVHCVFSSKLGRIVQEQGRIQLEAFGPTGNWGTADAPNCEGFSPLNFSSLDFGKIDMSSAFPSATVNQSQIQGDAANAVQNFFNK